MRAKSCDRKGEYMIIDAHTHTCNNEFRCTLSDISKSMKRYGIDKSIVFPEWQKNINGLVSESLKNLRSNDKKFFYFLRFNPHTITLTKLRNLSTLFSGFKLHPRTENFDPLSTKFRPIFELLQELGKPVLIHSRKEDYKYSDPSRLIKLAKTYPDLNFIFGHFAADSEKFFDRFEEQENAFVETSIISSPKLIERRVDSVGADKILFGSDFPFSDQEIELLKIKKCMIKNSDKQKILYKNALKLLKTNVA